MLLIALALVVAAAGVGAWVYYDKTRGGEAAAQPQTKPGKGRGGKGGKGGDGGPIPVAAGTAQSGDIPIYLSGVLRSTSIRFGAVFAAIRTPLSGAALAGVAAWSVAHLGSAAWLNLVVGSVVGGLVYLIITGRTLAAYAPQRIQQIRLLAPKDSGHRRPADG